ncbi:O-acetylhomoserine aminocarboxypropyltransferase/cysteine synthase family protein [Peptoniphilus catoniae]|uniref:O-acetylhomoserine aminocarboxypropyltransferase/cysteine synthase family protein n=1 Tax=Peptoniphilus catoniae TaxID=1660341 RepID=UPI0010FEAD93|nr:O-acetylhomoserine aminocarboxypropyltransferase/cysteine synthase family protein [Peptoniphilus catoniae]
MQEKDIRNLKLDSICVQGGYQPKNGEPRIAPIVQSTTYKYDNADTVGNLFDLKESGYFYTRLANPTLGYLEEKVAQLEGGIAAVATSSGQAATLLSILTICSNGDHIISMNNLYGGTHTLLGSTIGRFGISTSFVNLNDIDEIRAAVRDNTKLIFAETIGNPAVGVLDIEKVANVAHEYGLPLIVDNTLASPVLCRPIDFGADIVTHSSTKYLDGHATSVGGIIVDSGKFDWTGGRFDCLTEPDPNYHGLSYTKSFGNLSYTTRARAVFMRDFGPIMSPFNGFLTNLGIETLALRMERHSKNALAIAQYLEGHDKVEWIRYPGLKSSEDKDLADKYLKNGASGVIAFGVKGGIEKTKKWIDSLKLISLVVHVADVRSHALHPASMTHRQLSEEDLLKAGIKPNMVRLSVGIENVEDIINDIDQAFKNI